MAIFPKGTFGKDVPSDAVTIYGHEMDLVATYIFLAMDPHLTINEPSCLSSVRLRRGSQFNQIIGLKMVFLDFDEHQLFDYQYPCLGSTSLLTKIDRCCFYVLRSTTF